MHFEWQLLFVSWKCAKNKVEWFYFLSSGKIKVFG